MSISNSPKIPVVWRIAYRELRGGLKGFRIFMACLILGVMAIAAVGSLTRGIEEGMALEGQSMLGGDVEVRAIRTDLTKEQRAWLEGQGTVSHSARLRTMAHTENGGSSLVELRAIDALYPLYGDFATSSGLTSGALTEMSSGYYGTAIESALAGRLKVKIGDLIKVGTIEVELRGLIENEPDKANLGFQLGPSVMISHEALDASGLVTIGSLLDRYYKLALPAETNVSEWKNTMGRRYPDARFGIRTRDNAAPGLRRFIERMSMFLTLVGLTALVVGGVGVGNAVKGYMDRKTKTIATLKILGATGQRIFQIYFIQVMLIGTLSVLIGVVGGAMLPDLLVLMLPDSLPINPASNIYPESLLLAAVYGFLITVAFTTWPLGRARDLPPVRLFRALVAPEKSKPRRAYVALVYWAAFMVVLLAVGLADNISLASGFVAGALISLIMLRGTGRMIEKVAAKLPRPKHALRRLALANIHRPGTATGAVVISLGLGLTLFAGLALVEGNLERELNNQVPQKAPAFFFLDIQSTEIGSFTDTVNSIDGTEDLRAVPSLRGRVTAVNGVEADKVAANSNVRWVLRGDRGLSYSAEAPEDSPIIEGTWWPEGYTGPPEISLDREAAEGIGLKIGDTMTMNIMGREITASIRSFREINWGTMDFNFVIMFDPYTLQAAPHTFMATLRAAGDAETLAYNTLTRDFPTVTAIRTKEIIEKGSVMLEQIGVAIRATGLVAIIAGIFVLTGAIAAGFKERVYDAVIMKVVGAVKSQILRAYLLEYLVIGTITAVIALILGGIAGYVVVAELMEMTFTLLPAVMISTVVASLLVTIVFGLLSSVKALSIRPNEVLRSE